MTDELKPVEGAENTPEPKAPEYTEIEQRAMEMGWRPLTEFNGDENDFIDAKEFVNRKPLFDKIESTGKELKQMRKAFDALKNHYTTVHETAYRDALNNLKQARKDAIAQGDGERFDQVDTEIKRVEAEAAKIQNVAEVKPEPEVHPQFVSWSNRNPWYNSVGYMRAYADEVGVKLGAQGVDPIEVLKRVEEAVRKEFPDKFRNSNKNEAPDVESSGRRTSVKKDDFQLNPQEERIFQTLHKSDPKTFTREKYVAELKAAKGIK